MGGTEVVIVGMSCRFPGADAPEQFWKNLIQGIDSLNQFGDYHPINDPDYTNSSLPFIKVNNLIKDYSCFDADFFGIGSKEAKIMDPQHRLFMECAWTAIEHAGYSPDSLPEITGLYAGVYANYYLLQNVYPSQNVQDPAQELSITIGNEKDHISSYTAYKLNLNGPVLTVQATCASSLSAVHLACEALMTYSADMMLAGGATISIPQVGGYLYQKGGLLSNDGCLRPYDQKASGTIYSNGVGVVVLKRLQDAIDDGDTIYAIIKGSAMNNDGSAKVGYTAPSVQGQVSVIKRALQNADVSSESITYLEGHGTGTAMGDRIELDALHHIFQNLPSENCALGSVKANIGHLGPASGISGLIKTSLALYHRTIPPSPHSTSPLFSSENSPFYINQVPLAWPQRTKKRYAGISSFGIGGTNVHLILEEPPVPKNVPYQQTNCIICLSAKTRKSLEKVIFQLLHYIRDNPTLDIRDIAYTLHVGRRFFSHRHTMIASSLEELQTLLTSYTLPPPCPDSLPQIRLVLDAPLPSLILYAQNTPDALANFYRLVTQFEEYSYAPIHINWETNLLTCKEIAIPLGFYSLLSLAVASHWLNSGLPITSLKAASDSLPIAAVLSKQLSLSAFFALLQNPLPFSLSLQKEGVYPICTNDDGAYVLHLDGTVPGQATLFSYEEVMAYLWQLGYTIHWPTFYKKSRGRRIPLPTYPFERIKHWIDKPVASQEKLIDLSPLSEDDILQEMLALWKQILGVDDLEYESNFFAYGGTSLIATSLMAAIQAKFHIDIELQDIFAHPTVEGVTSFVLDKLFLNVDEKLLQSALGELYGK